MPGWKQAQTDAEIGTIWTVSPSTAGWSFFFGYAYHSRTHSYYAKSIWIRNRHTRLKRTAFDASPYLTPGNYISPILNTVCTFSFDNEATQRDPHNELEKLCTVIMHNDDLYLETMSVLGKLNWNEEYGYVRWLKLKTCGMNLSNSSHRCGRLLA